MKRRLFRRARAGFAVLTAIVCAAALAAASASAAQTHDFLGTVGAGELTAATGVAVDNANGDLYVADQGAGLLRRYAPDGTPAPFSTSGEPTLGPLTLPAGSFSPVAVDNSTGTTAGEVYAIAGNTVRAYKASGVAASFATQSSYAVANTLVGTPTGGFGSVSAVTVDSNGAIYVSCLETGSGQEFVAVYSARGKYLTSFGGGGSFGIASEPTHSAEPEGIVYTSVPSFSITNSWKPEPFPVTAASGFNGPNYPQLPFPHGIAVEPANGDLLVNGGGEISEFTPFAANNEPVTTFGADQLAAGGSSGLAVDGSTGADAGDVYVANGATVERFGPLVNAPDVVTEPATVNSAAATATLKGTIDPDGEAITECVFEYGTTPALGETVPCVETAAEIEAEPAPVSVHANLTGLEVANYSFRLRAAGPEGSIAGAKLTFSTTSAPAVDSESAEPRNAEATLLASLSSGNLATSYHFEYGLTDAYGSSTPAGTIPASPAPRAVSAAITGLAPGTTYHFRAVASNGVGPAFGPDQTFTTTTPGGAAGCPNEALRLGASALLPDCRAYELASPADKAGGEVFGLFNSQVSTAGNAIAYLSDAAFPGATANNLLGTYVSTRNEAGGGSWSTFGPDAPQYNERGLLEISTLAYNSSLTEALEVSRLALAPGAIEHGTNLYVRDLASGAWTTIAALPTGAQFQSLTSLPSLYVGGTPNWSHLILETEIPLSPDAAGLTVYDFTGGQLQIVSRSPDGEVEPSGVSSAVTSADGSRTFFSSPLNGALYVHEAGAATRLVSHSHVGGPVAEAEPQYAGATVIDADGGIAYFTAPEGLVAGSGEHAGETLYRWESQGDRLSEITQLPASAPEGAQLNGLTAASSDGSYVYFAAQGVLANGATPATLPATNLYAWHAGTFKFIAQTEAEFNEGSALRPSSLVSPNGEHFAFSSLSKLTPDVVRGPNCPDGNLFAAPEPCSEVFVFDYPTGKLTCASCDGAGLGNSVVGGLEGAPLNSAREDPAVLNDGAVYFNTPNALEPRDSNRQVDVYEWRDGRARLISSGSSEAESIFSGASADGSDVYIKTKQQLVGVDVDQRFDIYDARVDGGIAAQEQTQASEPCEGEACRGASPAPPPQVGTSSAPCAEIAAQARSTRARARSLARRAKEDTGKKGRALRHRASAERKRAKRLKSKTNTCRRQGR